MAKSTDILRKAADHIDDRASQRDCPGGERSMAKTVAAFNALEGTSLTETQGWRFMIALKYARATAGEYVEDDYEDLAAYAALAAEAEAEKMTLHESLTDRNTGTGINPEPCGTCGWVKCQCLPKQTLKRDITTRD